MDLGNLFNGASVVVKTQYGPPITVYTQGAPSTPSLFADLVTAGVQVRDGNGHVVASFGNWPITSPLAVTALAAVLGAFAFVFIRGLRG